MVGGEVMEARLDEWPVRALEACLDRPGARPVGAELPPLWHWLYFPKAARRRDLGVDGHAAVAHADPAKPMRRLFASARIEYERPLCLGADAQMTESILRSRDTQGSSGPLRIVTHQFAYRQNGRDCIREERDIVYRQEAPAPENAAHRVPPAGSAAASADAASAGAAPDWSEVFTPDAVLLFRFSALTFNGHRIHYDQQYAQMTEGHRERVVHGPLVAILLAEALRERRSGELRRFEFWARRPMFVDQPISISGQAAADSTILRARDASGAVAMEAAAYMAAPAAR